MEAQRKREFLWLVGVVAVVQIADLIGEIPKDRYWFEYLFNSFRDYSGLLIIYYAGWHVTSRAAKHIATLQWVSLIVHFLGWSAETIHNNFPQFSLVDSTGQYIQALQFILGLKMIVLVYGGYDVFRDRHSGMVGRHIYPRAVLFCDENDSNYRTRNPGAK